MTMPEDSNPPLPDRGFLFGEERIAPGTQRSFDLPISRLSSGQSATMPVRILHGAKPGPTLFVSAAIHGDEITGVEIVRRLLKRVSPKMLAGTLMCVPIVNVYGFVGNSRYLPDRRDLNRSFPGSPRGSLASQLAYIFRTQVIERADFGIDLHSAAIHRMNLPQIRVSHDSPRAQELALVFGAPAVITAPLRENSLRKVAAMGGVEMLLYEAGEGLRFDDLSIRTGLNGILRVMAAMDMIAPKRLPAALPVSARSNSTAWVRAPRGGLCLMEKKSGDVVTEGQALAIVTDPLSEDDEVVRAPFDGVIIGHATMPIVNRGDALLHIAMVERHDTVEHRVNAISDTILSDVMLDEDEIL
jgi:uncharacterized protein